MQVALLILGALSTVKVRMKHILPQVHVFTSSYKKSILSSAQRLLILTEK